ncbi:hypothetical protein D3C86_1349100 [compost metagenome]
MLAAQVGDAAGYFDGIANAAHGDLRGIAVVDARRGVLGHGGEHAARRHRVAGDAVRTHLRRRGAGQAQHRGFAHHVQRTGHDGFAAARQRCHVHDAAPPFFHHAGQHQLRHLHQGQGVDAHDFEELLFRGVQQALRLAVHPLDADAGVVDQNIDGAVPAQDVSRHFPHLRGAFQIQDHRPGAIAQRFADLRELSGVAVREIDDMPRLEKFHSGGKSDATGSARNQCDLTHASPHALRGALKPGRRGCRK